MNVLITGGFGFIGKHLISRLIEEEVASITVLTRNLSEESDFMLVNSKVAVNVILGDLEKLPLLKLFEKADVVIHLAWKSNPVVTGKDVSMERIMNWGPSKLIIDCCAEVGVKLIFISSGGTVYGNPVYLPLDEIHPKNPISAYGRMKYAVEEEILRKCKSHNLRYVILRPSNTYGPGFDTTKGYGVIGHWIKNIRENQSIVVVGDGTQIKDFVHIDDLCSAIVTSFGCENRCYNVGGGESTSLIGLKKIFEGELLRDLETVHLPTREYDVENNSLSIKKILSETKWEPQVRLKVGIKQLIDTYLN